MNYEHNCECPDESTEKYPARVHGEKILVRSPDANRRLPWRWLTISSRRDRTEPCDCSSHLRFFSCLRPRKQQFVLPPHEARVSAGATRGDSGDSDRGGFDAGALDSPNPELSMLFSEFNPRYRHRSIGEQLRVHPADRSHVVDSN